MDEQEKIAKEPDIGSRTDDDPEVEGHLVTGPSSTSDPSAFGRDAGEDEADVEGHMLADPDGNKRYDKFDKF